jgi:hypothetical protein
MARELRAPQRPQNDRPDGGSVGRRNRQKGLRSRPAQPACRDLSYKNRRSPLSAELARRVKKNPQETWVSAVVPFPKIRFLGTDSRAGMKLLLPFNA